MILLVMNMKKIIQKRRSNKMDLNTIFENAIKQGMTNPEEWMYM